jgi:hypothetical protein
VNYKYNPNKPSYETGPSAETNRAEYLEEFSSNRYRGIRFPVKPFLMVTTHSQLLEVLGSSYFASCSAGQCGASAAPVQNWRQAEQLRM